jgi:hypothetical protein
MSWRTFFSIGSPGRRISFLREGRSSVMLTVHQLHGSRVQAHCATCAFSP